MLTHREHLKKAKLYYNEGSNYDANKDLEHAVIEYKKSLDEYRLAERAFSSLMTADDQKKRATQEKHLCFRLNITETHCMVMTGLTASPEALDDVKQRFQELSQELNVIKESAARISGLSTTLKGRINKLSIHIYHKEYIYQHNLAADFFNFPLPEDSTDEKAYDNYCKNKRAAIQAGIRVLQLLNFPNTTSFTINAFHKKRPTDAEVRVKFIALFKTLFEKNYIDPLSNFERKTHSPATKIKILTSIIDGSTDFLDFFEKNIAVLPCKFYFTLFKALQDLCEKLADGNEKTHYLEKFKAKLQYYISSPSIPPISKPTDLHELLSYIYYVQQNTTTSEAEILATANYFSKTIFPFDPWESMTTPWLRKMIEGFGDILAVEEFKNYGPRRPSVRERQQELAWARNKSTNEKKPSIKKEEKKITAPTALTSTALISTTVASIPAPVAPPAVPPTITSHAATPLSDDQQKTTLTTETEESKKTSSHRASLKRERSTQSPKTSPTTSKEPSWDFIHDPKIKRVKLIEKTKTPAPLAPSSRLFTPSDHKCSAHLLMGTVLDKAATLENLYCDHGHRRTKASNQILSSICFALTRTMEEKLSNHEEKLDAPKKITFDLYALKAYQFCLDLGIEPADYTKKRRDELCSQYKKSLASGPTIDQDIQLEWSKELATIGPASGLSLTDRTKHFLDFYLQKIEKLFGDTKDFKGQLLDKVIYKLNKWTDNENNQHRKKHRHH